MRTRSQYRAVLGLAIVAALSVTLSACNDDAANDPKASGTTSTAASPAGTAGSTGGAATTPSRPGNTAQPTSASAPAPGGTTGSAAGGDDCVLTTMKFSLKEAPAMPLAVVLTATNTGSAACSLHLAPFVSDPVAGHNLAVNESTKPPAAVTVAPGKSAYASIAMAQRESTQNHRAKTLNITLAGKTGGGTDGHATVESPGPAGLQVNPSTRVSYWRTTEEAALG